MSDAGFFSLPNENILVKTSVTLDKARGMTSDDAIIGSPTLLTHRAVTVPFSLNDSNTVVMPCVPWKFY